MKNTNWITKLLAIVGTLLVTLPVLAPIIFSAVQLVSAGNLMFDYLMPAELGLPVLIGAGMLLWAAIRSKLLLKWIAWCTGFAVVLVFGGQAVALVTGLASDRIDATGWQYSLVVGSMIGYDLAVVGLATGGIRLWGQLLQRPRAEKLNK